MIKSFRCKHTEALVPRQADETLPGLSVGRGAEASERDIARRIEDLRIPPAKRLEALKGDRRGQFSIRVNDQWRLCFRFEDGNAYAVEIVDYH